MQTETTLTDAGEKSVIYVMREYAAWSRGGRPWDLRTLQLYEYELGCLEWHLHERGITKLSAVTRPVLMEFVREYHGRYSIIVRMQNLFRYAKQSGAITVDPNIAILGDFLNDKLEAYANEKRFA